MKIRKFVDENLERADRSYVISYETVMRRSLPPGVDFIIKFDKFSNLDDPPFFWWNATIEIPYVMTLHLDMSPEEFEKIGGIIMKMEGEL